MQLMTKRGRLTSYGFACGYVARDDRFTLYREHGVYFVSGIGVDGARHFYSFRTLTEAWRGLRSTANAWGTGTRVVA